MNIMLGVGGRNIIKDMFGSIDKAAMHIVDWIKYCINIKWTEVDKYVL